MENLHGGEDNWEDESDGDGAAVEDADQVQGVHDAALPRRGLANQLGVHGDESDSDEEGGVDEDDERPRNRRIRRKDRAVHDLDSALDIDNYDQYQTPEVRLEYTAVLEKGNRNQADKTITWENQPRVRVGRRSRENIIGVQGG